MPTTCVTCLTPANLLSLYEREWKLLEYLIYPHQKQLTGILKENKELGICDKCQSNLTCVDDFITSAKGNFNKHKEQWIKGIQTNQIEIKIETSMSVHVKSELDPEQVFIKREPIHDDVGALNEDVSAGNDDNVTAKLENDYDHDDSGMVTEDISTKIMLANMLQNMYVVQPPPTPQTIQVIDVGMLKNLRTDETLESETNVAEAGCCTSGETKRKHIKKTKNSTEEPVDEGPPNKKKPKEPQTTKNKQMKCEYCPIRFDTHEDRQKHVDTAHDSTPAKTCDICSTPFHNVYKYNAHMKKHGSTVHCDLCDRWYSPNTYKIHMRTSRKHNKVEDFKYGCDQCDARFPLKLYLERHVTSVHEKLKPYTCSHCPAAYARPDRLKDHVNIAHEKQPPAKNHTCEECGVKMRSKKELQAHMVRHTGARPYKCKICLSTFGYYAALYTHNKLMHENVKRPFGKKNILTDQGNSDTTDSETKVKNSENKKGDSAKKNNDNGEGKEKSEEKAGNSDAHNDKSEEELKDIDANRSEVNKSVVDKSEEKIG